MGCGRLISRRGRAKQGFGNRHPGNPGLARSRCGSFIIGMELVAVRCQNCGSSLKLDPEARFVTCKHCASQLEVRHTEGAAFTKVLEEVEGRLEDTEREISRLRLMHELESKSAGGCLTNLARPNRIFLLRQAAVPVSPWSRRSARIPWLEGDTICGSLGQALLDSLLKVWAEALRDLGPPVFRMPAGHSSFLRGLSISRFAELRDWCRPTWEGNKRWFSLRGSPAPSANVPLT